MEEKNYGEQLSNHYTTSATDSVGFENASLENVEGSPSLGKFKNVDELLKAYNSLQSEFTKKCQSLNEVLKKKEEIDNACKTPIYESNDWQTQVDNFLKRCPQAKDFSKQIAELVISDKDLICNQNSLELAYGKVMEKENSRLNNLLNDKDYLIQTLDQQDREKIVKDYLNRINNNVPSLMNSKNGNNVMASYKRPNSVGEAGEMAKKLFK